MPQKKKLKDDEAHAAFVFTGKVIKIAAALMENVVTKNTLIVEVQHIIKVPAMFASITGQQVTVRLKKLPKLKKNAVITVFANGWIFGETIAVDAVSFSEETSKTTMAASINTTMTATSDADLKDRIDSAEIGVVGKVTKVQKASVPDMPLSLTATKSKAKSKKDDPLTTKISEHDPNWHQATIKVDEVLKGPKSKKDVKVLFPKSDDVRWYKVAKFDVGQQGVWLLQKGNDQDVKGIPPKLLEALPGTGDDFTALHAKDFLPLNELDKVKSLIKN
ncbi:MAG: hypothetical protein M3139_18050 [Bacteroidota bacterium]|nr:hypothetical protein [Bacteroidota bacterium]